MGVSSSANSSVDESVGDMSPKITNKTGRVLLGEMRERETGNKKQKNETLLFFAMQKM